MKMNFNFIYEDTANGKRRNVTGITGWRDDSEHFSSAAAGKFGSIRLANRLFLCGDCAQAFAVELEQVGGILFGLGR
jgi:hypothetical protein